jgi:hypothetical protein
MTSLKIQNGGSPHPQKPYSSTLERSSKYHLYRKKTLLTQYIGSKLSNKTLHVFVYKLSNSVFCDPILSRKMTTPISQNQHQ